MDFETSVQLCIPEYSHMDSDKNNYFVSEKTQRDMYFNTQSEDTYQEETYWK